jgi:hypothetical protein
MLLSVSNADVITRGMLLLTVLARSLTCANAAMNDILKPLSCRVNKARVHTEYVKLTQVRQTHDWKGMQYLYSTTHHGDKGTT